jgi:hypothetical protein
MFERYIGIDYSGAVTPESSCKGIRVYVAEVPTSRSKFYRPQPTPVLVPIQATFSAAFLLGLLFSLSG